MIKESIKDIALVPDNVLLPMVDEFANAMAFVAHGSMSDLEGNDDAEPQ